MHPAEALLKVLMRRLNVWGSELFLKLKKISGSAAQIFNPEVECVKDLLLNSNSKLFSGSAAQNCKTNIEGGS